MKEGAYTALAEWFEYLNDDCDYEQWSQYLLMLLKEQNAGVTGLDIGCGAGCFTRALARAGYAVTGVDISEQMLSCAVEKSLDEGLRIPYLLMDVTKLKLPAKVDFAVSLNDCFNYVKKDKIVTAFKRVAGVLKKNGLFYFDISSKEKLTSLPPVSIDDREEVTYFAFHSVKNDQVTMDVSLFIAEENGVYIRKDEQHAQYIYEDSEVLSALDEAGFTLVFCRGHLGTERENAQRIEFLVRRR